MHAPRVVQAVHGRQVVEADPSFEVEFSQSLAGRCSRADIMALYDRFIRGEDHVAVLMRRICVRALAKRCGDGLWIGPGVGLRHLETFEIGDGVVIGEQAVLHGRFDGACVIGDKVWIGPQAFLDARNLVIGDNVGWGPGAKILGSTHTGLPLDRPVIETDLVIRATVVEDDADIGVNAVLLPGVRIGRGAIVGAGSVVTRDVAPMSKVAGSPAKLLGLREDAAPTGVHR